MRLFSLLLFFFHLLQLSLDINSSFSSFFLPTLDRTTSKSFYQHRQRTTTQHGQLFFQRPLLDLDPFPLFLDYDIISFLQHTSCWPVIHPTKKNNWYATFLLTLISRAHQSPAIAFGFGFLCFALGSFGPRCLSSTFTGSHWLPLALDGHLRPF